MVNAATTDERSTMLILTRKVGEKLMVGDDISLVIVGIRGNQVRIGVDAPKDVSVHREEIYQRIQQEKAIKKERENSRKPLTI